MTDGPTESKAELDNQKILEGMNALRDVFIDVMVSGEIHYSVNPNQFALGIDALPADLIDIYKVADFRENVIPVLDAVVDKSIGLYEDTYNPREPLLYPTIIMADVFRFDELRALPGSLAVATDIIYNRYKGFVAIDVRNVRIQMERGDFKGIEELQTAVYEQMIILNRQGGHSMSGNREGIKYVGYIKREEPLK